MSRNLKQLSGGAFMLSAYPACFFHEENGFSVIFPDLNYLSTCGDSLNEALEMSIDCLAGYLFWTGKRPRRYSKTIINF